MQSKRVLLRWFWKGRLLPLPRRLWLRLHSISISIWGPPLQRQPRQLQTCLSKSPGSGWLFLPVRAQALHAAHLTLDPRRRPQFR